MTTGVILASIQTLGSLAAASLSREELPERFWVQCSQRHQGSDRNVLVVHQVLFGEGQRFHNGSCLLLGLRVDQEHNAFAIATRIPLPDLPVEVELYCCLNLLRHDGHDLLRSYALSR